MPALYNEIEPYPAAWLRNLIDGEHIALGTVDERSIAELHAKDVRDATQAHFFAGIGGWSHALQLAGWPDTRPVWTGSCPCQPFSSAGKGRGVADERHLWPEWFRLIRECRPPVVLGEQVASPAGLGWLDVVFANLESEGYAVGAADLCAAGVGAPHIRQRLWFAAYDTRSRVAHNDAHGRGELRAARVHAHRAQGYDSPGRSTDVVGAIRLGDAGRDGNQQHARELPSDESQHEIGGAVGNHAPVPPGPPDDHAGDVANANKRECGSGRASPPEDGRGDEPHGSRVTCVVANADGPGPQGRDGSHNAGERLSWPRRSLSEFWANAEWVPCRDGKARPIEPSTFPLAHGVPNRMGRLRAYGNAINAQTAVAFITVVMECLAEIA